MDLFISFLLSLRFIIDTVVRYDYIHLNPFCFQANRLWECDPTVFINGVNLHGISLVSAQRLVLVQLKISAHISH